MHRNTKRVVEAAAASGVEIEPRRFPKDTRTADDAAAAIGCPVGAIVKSLVLDSDAGPIIVFTSGENRVDYQKVGAAIGAGSVTRADADTVRAVTGQSIGGVAPFGHPEPRPMLFDEALLAYETIWAAAGTPDTVFPIRPEDLIRATGAQMADVAEE